MHKDSPILKKLEEHQGHILDIKYTKVDFNEMLDNLHIQQSSKHALESTLKKFPKLFGGGLGKFDMKPIPITLKEGPKLYQGRYFNIMKAYNNLTRIEIDRLVARDILQKLRYSNDSPLAAPTFT